MSFLSSVAVLALGVLFRFRERERSARLCARFGKLWVFAEVLLFALVGAEVDVTFALASAFSLLPVLFLSLVFRAAGVWVSLTHTPLNIKERLFCVIAYLPKATVQAAIGGLALAAGLSSGELILTCAVLAILVTAPLGAYAIDLSYRKLLTKSENTVPDKKV